MVIVRMKLNYLDGGIIVDLFNSLLPDNYVIYETAKASVKYDSVWKKTEYFIPVRFCRKHRGVTKRIDGTIYASVRVHNGIIELDYMTLNVDPYQWEGGWDTNEIYVKFIRFRDCETLRHSVSYAAKCLMKGCPTVTIEVHV